MEALCKYISGVALSLAALFAPIVPLIWCVVGFICFDFVTGIMASRAEAREQGQEWYFESHLAWRTAEKLGFTIIALCMAFCIDELMLDFRCVLRFIHADILIFIAQLLQDIRIVS